MNSSPDIIAHILFENRKRKVFEILEQVQSGSISGRMLDLRLRGALGCVLEKDTLSSVKYWFNPGNVHLDMTEKMLTGINTTKQ